MKRDGALTSAWQNLEDYVSNIPEIPEHTSFDVVIVGGGITGITTALLLQKEGLKCALAESNCIGFGTSGGTTAHLNTMLDTDYHQLIKNFGLDNAKLVHKAAKRALKLVDSNVSNFNIECDYTSLPGYIYAQNKEQSERLSKIVEDSKKVGVYIDFAENLPIHANHTDVARFEDQAQFHPTKYIYSLVKEFENAGGIVFQNCRALETKEEEFIEINTSIGTLKSKKIVYATHTPLGMNVLHFRNAPYRSYVLCVLLKSEDQYPESLIYDMHDPYYYYRTHTENGQKYLIAGGQDHKTAHEENTDDCFRKLELEISKHFTIDKIIHKWSSQFFEPSDGLPFIGHLPGASKNYFVATGFSGNGMTYGTLSAIIIAELIVNGQSEFMELFSPSRINTVGIGTFLKEQVDVVSSFVGDWLTQPVLKQLSELSHDEGKVVKFDSKSIAVYKDMQGSLHAVNPSCPHAKCSVGWNSAEKSWDCPCHGSRFTYNGDVLTAPAYVGLENIDLNLMKAD